METIFQRTAHHPFAGVKQVRYLTDIQAGGKQKDGSELLRIQNVQQRRKPTFHSKIPLVHPKPRARLVSLLCSNAERKSKAVESLYFRCAIGAFAQVLYSMNESPVCATDQFIIGVSKFNYVCPDYGTGRKIPPEQRSSDGVSAVGG